MAGRSTSTKRTMQARRTRGLLYLTPVLMLAGVAGIILTSSAWAPVTEIDYGNAGSTYNNTYKVSADYKYSNLAVQEFYKAVSRQLKGWSDWETVSYNIYQLEGDVTGVYSSRFDQITNKDNYSQYTKKYSGNVFDTLANATSHYAQSSPELSACVRTKGEYSYEAFSGMVQCLKDNGQGERTSIFSVYEEGLLKDPC